MEEYGGDIIIGLVIVTLCIFMIVSTLVITLMYILVKKTSFFKKFEEYLITSENQKVIKKLKKEQKENKND